MTRLWDYRLDKARRLEETVQRRDAQVREDAIRHDAQTREDKIRSDKDLRDTCVQFILASDLLYDKEATLMDIGDDDLAAAQRPDRSQVRQLFTVLYLTAPDEIILAADDLFTTLYDWTAIAEGGTPYTSGLRNRSLKRDALVEAIRKHFYPDGGYLYIRSPT